MTAVDGVGWRGMALAFLRSYAADLRSWAVGLATRYGVAVTMTITGVFAVLAAGAVGVIALFRFIESQYGTVIAYASIGGGLLAVGLALLSVSWAILRKDVPPLPRPRRRAQSVTRRMVAPVAVRTIAALRGGDGVRADPVTQLLAAAAATVLVGWIVASRLEGRARTTQVRR
jgi:hypothetical protein